MGKIRHGLPDHLKFGYAHMKEMQEIEASLAHLKNPERFFAASAEYMRRYANDPTYRERQEAARERGEKWVSPTPGPSQTLTRDEIEYLIERLNGVNDPTGISALNKLLSHI